MHRGGGGESTKSIGKVEGATIFGRGHRWTILVSGPGGGPPLAMVDQGFPGNE